MTTITTTTATTCSTSPRTRTHLRPMHCPEPCAADTTPWLDTFTPQLLEEDLGLEPGQHGTQTMLIVNLGAGGAGLVVSFLAAREFGVGRVVVVVPGCESGEVADQVDAVARRMGAVDVLVLRSQDQEGGIGEQLREIGVGEVAFVVLCWSTYVYTGPHVGAGSSELGAGTESCAVLPGIDELDGFLARVTAVWNVLVAGGVAAERDRDGANGLEGILVQLARSYPDEEYWSRLLGCESAKLALKSVILLQRVGVNYSRLQVVVGEKDG